MPENDIRTLVSLEADKSGVDSARAALKQVIKEQDKLVDSFARGEVDAKAYNKQLRELEANEKDLKRAIDSVTGEFTEQTRAMKEAAAAAADLAREQAELSTAEGRFGKVSQDVALAGDTESGLRTIGGAAGFFGATGIEKVLSGAGEIFAVVEALPKLQAAAAGLPAVINAAALAMGTSSTGFIGALGAIGIALIAVTVAVKTFLREMGRQADELRGIVSAKLNVERLVSGGGTVSEAQSRIAGLQANREAELRVLAQLEKQYEQTIGEQGLVGLALEKLTPQGRALIDEIDKLRKSSLASKDEILLLELAIEGGRLVTKEAITEEKALASARDDSTAAAQRAARTEKQSQKKFKSTGLLLTASSFGLLGTNPAEIEKEKEDARKLANDRLEIEHQFAQDEMALRQDLADQRFALQLDEFRDTQDSIRDFQRSRFDALQEGNFLALREINQNERRTADDRRLEVRRANEDINREGERSRRELQQESINAMQELNAVVNAGLTGVVNQFNSAFGAINQSQSIQLSAGMFGLFPRSAN